MAIEVQEFRERLVRLQEKLIANELDAFLISAKDSIFYLTGISYGIQFNLGSEQGVMLTPYFMAVDQTVSSDLGPDTDVSSSVIGLDILINNLSLAALFQSSDDTDIVMFSIGSKCLYFLFGV